MFDPDALDQHRRILLASSARWVGADRADDLVQETLIRALVARPGADRDLLPWLLRVARNLAIDEFRRARPADPVEEGDLSSEPGEPRSGLAPHALLRLLGMVSPGEADVVLLRDVLDLSVADTALVLGSTAGGVRVLHTQARRKLAAAPPAAEPGPKAFAALDRFLREVVLGRLVALAPTSSDGTAPGFLGAPGVRAELRGLLDVAVAAADRSADPETVAAAARARALSLLLDQDLDAATGEFARAEEAAVVAGDAASVARCRLARAWIGMVRGHWPEALAVVERVLADAGTSPREVRRGWIMAATLHAQLRRYDLARDALARGVPVPTDEPIGEAVRCNAAAVLALREDRYDDARAVLLEGLAVARSAGDAARATALLANLGIAELGAQRDEAASSVLAEALADARRLCLPALEGMALSTLGFLAWARGAWSEAAEWLLRAVEASRRAGDDASRLISARGLAIVEIARGRPEAAARHLDEVLPLAARTGAGPEATNNLRLASALVQLARGDLAGGRATLAACHVTGVPGELDAHRAIALAFEGDVAGAEAALAALPDDWLDTRLAKRVARAVLDRGLRSPGPNHRGGG